MRCGIKKQNHPREGTAAPKYFPKQSFWIVVVANCGQGHQPPPVEKIITM